MKGAPQREQSGRLTEKEPSGATADDGSARNDRSRSRGVVPVFMVEAGGIRDQRIACQVRFV
jgi:hypothetical protein